VRPSSTISTMLIEVAQQHTWSKAACAFHCSRPGW
jgi:hypothetical protein